MDVLWFMKQRTAFIRRYYKTAVAPFLEVIRKIEAVEAPTSRPTARMRSRRFLKDGRRRIRMGGWKNRS